MRTKNARFSVSGAVLLAACVAVVMSGGCDRSRNAKSKALDGWRSVDDRPIKEAHKSKVSGLGDIWSYEFNLPTQYLKYAMGSDGALWVFAYPVESKALLLMVVEGRVEGGFKVQRDVAALQVNSKGPVTLGNGPGPNHVETCYLIQYDLNGRVLWQHELLGQAGVNDLHLATTEGGDVLAFGKLLTDSMNYDKLFWVTPDGKFSEVVGDERGAWIQGVFSSTNQLFAAMGSGLYRVENGVLMDRVFIGSLNYPGASVRFGENGKPYFQQQGKGILIPGAYPELPIVPELFMAGFHIGSSDRRVTLKDKDNGLVMYRDGRRTRFEASKDLPLWGGGAIAGGRNGWILLSQGFEDQGTFSGKSRVILIHLRP